MSNSLLNGVQTLRGLAALSVMFFHFRWNINEVYPGLGDALFGWGASGVDLFFIISGFVITLSWQKTPATGIGAYHFLKRRFFRIFPAYYAILLFTFLLSGAMSIFHYPDKTRELISALLFNPIDASHAPFYVNDNGMYGIRWTLNYELYFYLIVGLFTLVPFRKTAIFIYFICTLFLMPYALTGNITLAPEGYSLGNVYLNFITNPMILLFIAGMILGLLKPFILKINATGMAITSGILLMFAAIQFSHNNYSSHGIDSSGWLYFLIMLAVIGSERVLGKFIPGVLVRLGDISFSLYLIHTLMNSGIGGRFESIGIHPGILRFFLSVGLSLILAWLSWRYIEQPFVRKMKDSSLKKSPQVLR